MTILLHRVIEIVREQEQIRSNLMIMGSLLMTTPNHLILILCTALYSKSIIPTDSYSESTFFTFLIHVQGEIKTRAYLYKGRVIKCEIYCIAGVTNAVPAGDKAPPGPL